MGMMPPTFRPHGRETRQQQTLAFDVRRGSARKRGYTTAWDKASRTHLAHHPLCEYCPLQGAPVTAATCVDHLYPHRGDQQLFWRTDLWVSSCANCHSGFKQTIERQGGGALDALARQLGRAPLADHPA